MGNMLLHQLCTVDVQPWKEGNVLFTDALNIFYLQLRGIGYMVKDHSDSERGNPLFLISCKSCFKCTIP